MFGRWPVKLTGYLFFTTGLQLYTVTVINAFGYRCDEKVLFINQGKRIHERGRRGSDGWIAPPDTLLPEAFRMVTTGVESGRIPYF